MELGEKLRQARLEAGLSQRQLCGDLITRNMLSLIEHGAARPSMDTLRALATRLGKPVSYFLEEDVVVSPSLPGMEKARQAYRAGDYAGVCQALEGTGGPDPVFQEEQTLLWFLSELALARQALDQGKGPYALELLERAGSRRGLYLTEDLERQRLLLVAQASPESAGAVADLLPGDDAALLVRARAAMDGGDARRAAALLEAAEDHRDPGWNLLRGDAFLSAGSWVEAADCYHRAETAFPRETAGKLERCYREMEDYRQAYLYACKLRESR